MNSEVKSFAGNTAINYDLYLAPFFFEPCAVDLAARIPSTGVENILEVAAGSGRVTFHLRKHFPKPVQIVATDISQDMLAIAAERLNDLDVEIKIANALQLPFDDNSFDVVVCQHGLMFFSDKQKAIDETYRVLKPGGRFLFSTWDKSENMPVLKTIFDDTVIPFFANEDTSRFRTPFSMYKPEVLKEMLQKSGFNQTGAEHVKLMGQTPSAKNLVDGFFLKQPMSGEVAKKNPSAVEVMSSSMQELLEKRFGTGQITAELSEFIAWGIK